MEEFHLEPGERIIRSVRKHWFVFFAQLLPFALLALLPLLLPNLLGGLAAQNTAFTVDLTAANPWLRLLLGSWWLILWIFAFNIFTQYYLNRWIITNTRIVYVYQHGFFSREVASFLLIRVQDVTVETYGFFATLLHYGNLVVQTASENSQHFRMTGIPDPSHLRDIIMTHVADLHDDGKANDSNRTVASVIQGIL